MSPKVSTLVEDYLPHLRRYARALSGGQAAGDTLAVHTLEKIASDVGLVDTTVEPKIALLKIFHTVWLDSDRAYQVSPANADLLEQKAQQRLQRLTPRAREAFLLRMLESIGIDGIAIILNVSAQEAKDLIDIGIAEMQSDIVSKVLIVEDEAVIVQDLCGIIEDMGHQIAGTARTFDEAMKLSNDLDFEIVLADIMLADGTSGIDVVASILDDHKETPIIFITAYPEKLLTGERPEPTYLIAKPFDEEQVRSAVSQALFFASSAAIR